MHGPINFKYTGVACFTVSVFPSIEEISDNV